MSAQPAVPREVPRRIHRAARTEDAVRGVINRRLTARGWRPAVLPFSGYGRAAAPGEPDAGWVRVLARVLLTPPGPGRRRSPAAVRGWRRFVAAPAPGVPVAVEVAGRRHEVVSGRDGYLDVVLPADLPPGPTEALVTVGGAPPVPAPLYVVPNGPGTGIVSDIDDTVMVTALPRPVVAFWNTFVRQEASRRPVPGMPLLYHALLDAHPGAFVVYLSTGPWNVAPALEQFLARNGYPPGPLLLTDWGPTDSAWFRSGQEHKLTQLGRLLRELPEVSWLLVGDDGQHDPEIYGRIARDAPDRVEAVVLRQLTVIEQVLTHGTAEPPEQGREAPAQVPEVRAPDGVQLLAALRRRGLLPQAPGWPTSSSGF